jgi:hypothetical protein
MAPSCTAVYGRKQWLFSSAVYDDVQDIGVALLNERSQELETSVMLAPAKGPTGYHGPLR